ncbi:MAG TPA: rhomboid family intramembrane serine protease [Vicinamibacterales bacterium]|nr:rhomboid family intramembrane serine protease [Vicinamibacterales bacterium]
MIPLRDVIPSRTFPAATLALVSTALLLFLVRELSAGSASRDGWMLPLAALFGHGGRAGFVADALCLWIFGETVEDRTGHARVLLIAVTGVATGAAAGAMLEAGPAALGTAAVAAVMGAYFARFARSRVLVLLPIPFAAAIVEVPATALLGAWALVHLAATAPGGGIDLDTTLPHAAAFGAGALLAIGLMRPERLRADWAGGGG